MYDGILISVSQHGPFCIVNLPFAFYIVLFKKNLKGAPVIFLLVDVDSVLMPVDSIDILIIKINK